MSGNYLFAADAFERLLNRQFRLADIRWVSRLYLTALQREQLEKEAPADLRKELLALMATVTTHGAPAQTALQMVMDSKDPAACATDALFGQLARALDRSGMSKRRRDHDVLAGEIAIRNHFCMVTADYAVNHAIRQCGGEALMLSEFLYPVPAPGTAPAPAGIGTALASGTAPAPAGTALALAPMPVSAPSSGTLPSLSALSHLR